MKSDRLYFVTAVALIISGCAGTAGRQAAAPVYDPYRQKYEPPVPSSKSKTPPSKAVVTTPLAPAPPPEWAKVTETSQASAPLSPVVVALLSDAERSTDSGQLDSAVATLERGLRIEPRNATLLYKLAQVRLKQGKPRLAEDLAKKSALLAGSDKTLKKKSWLLVAEARKAQGNTTGAKEAEFKASEL